MTFLLHERLLTSISFANLLINNGYKAFNSDFVALNRLIRIRLVLINVNYLAFAGTGRLTAQRVRTSPYSVEMKSLSELCRRKMGLNTFPIGESSHNNTPYTEMSSLCSVVTGYVLDRGPGDCSSAVV